MRIPASQEEYLLGGCLDYAFAVIDTYGGRLYVVTVGHFVHHVVVRIGDKFVDVLGHHSKQELLDLWEEHKQHPGVVAVRLARATDLREFDTDEDRYERAVCEIQPGR